MLVPWKKSYDDKPRQCIKKQRHHFADTGPYSQRHGSSSSHVWMWELDHKEGWVLKNWCFQTVVLEKTLESPLDCKEIKPVNPKGNPPWIFTGRTDAKAEARLLWPPNMKSWLIGKDFDCGKDRGQGEKKAAVDEMAGGQHWLNGRGVWANSGRKWTTGKPGALQFTGSQRTGHNVATEQGWWSLMVTEVVWARPKGVTMVSRRWFFSEWVRDWQIGNKKIESIGRRP